MLPRKQSRCCRLLTIQAVVVQTVAGKDAFEAWFRKYLETFRLGNVSSEQFKELFLSDFGHLPAAKDIDWETWFFGKGTAQETLMAHAFALADRPLHHFA